MWRDVFDVIGIFTSNTRHRKLRMTPKALNILNQGTLKIWYLENGHIIHFRDTKY